jgi:hypothetical protein
MKKTHVPPIALTSGQHFWTQGLLQNSLKIQIYVDIFTGLSPQSELGDL